MPSSTLRPPVVSGEPFPRAIRTGTRCIAITSSGPKTAPVNGSLSDWPRRCAQREGRHGEPSAGIVDARSVRAGATVSKKTKGFDAGKRINGRKTFGIVDTLGLLMAVVVVAASTSDNIGGITVADHARHRSSRFAQLWCDSGFKRTFIEHCRCHHVGVEVVNRIHPGRFEALPQALDRRTHLVVAHEQPTPPGRLRTRSDRDRGLHLGRPQPLSPASTHPVADLVIALGKYSRQSLTPSPGAASTGAAAPGRAAGRYRG